MKTICYKSVISILFLIVFSSVLYADIDNFLGEDIVAAVRIDYKSISKDPVMKSFYTNGMVKDKIDSYEVFIEKTGFKPEKDLDNIYALFSNEVISGKSKKTAIIFNGIFDVDKMTLYFKEMQKNGKKMEYIQVNYKDNIFYKTPDGSCFVFFDNTNLLLGNLEFSKNLYDRYINNKNILKENLPVGKADQFKKYFEEHSGDHINGLIKMLEETKIKIKKKYPGQAVFADIEEITFSGKIVPDLSLEIHMNTDKAESATQISSMMNNLKLAGTLYGARFGLLDIISAIKITSSELATILNIDLTYAQIKESTKKIKQLIPKSMIDKVKDKTVK